MDSTSELGLPLFLILCGILGMLLLAIAVIVFFLVYQKRLFAQKENMQKLEANYQKDMLQYSFEAQEAERRRIAYDLHDEIGSILSATRIYLHQLDPNLSTESFDVLKNDSTELIDNAIDQIRIITQNLYPPNLELLGLIQASKDLCSRIQKVKGIDVEFEYNQEIKFTKQKELNIYRILQELTNNTLKHARATKIEIKFIVSLEGFEMQYSDNGEGMNYEKNKLPLDALGLKSIESRANSMDAKVELKSALGQGMDFKLHLGKN